MSTSGYYRCENPKVLQLEVACRFFGIHHRLTGIGATVHYLQFSDPLQRAGTYCALKSEIKVYGLATTSLEYLTFVLFHELWHYMQYKVHKTARNERVDDPSQPNKKWHTFFKDRLVSGYETEEIELEANEQARVMLELFYGKPYPTAPRFKQDCVAGTQWYNDSAAYADSHYSHYFAEYAGHSYGNSSYEYM